MDSTSSAVGTANDTAVAEATAWAVAVARNAGEELTISAMMQHPTHARNMITTTALTTCLFTIPPPEEPICCYLVCHRGRTASYPTALAQIPTCGFLAPDPSDSLASASPSAFSPSMACHSTWPSLSKQLIPLMVTVARRPLRP